MQIDKQILDVIRKYLRREESTVERKELYNWYELLGKGSPLLSGDKVVELHQSSKRRLFDQIGVKLVTRSLLSPMWYRVAAAILLSTVTYFSFDYFYNREVLIAVSIADIPKLAPESGKATMTLSTGEVLTLDTLGDLGTARLGQATISNKGSGTLTYKAGNNSDSEHTIGTLETAKAALFNIELSDGTRVWLNEKSKLSFPERFGKGDRVVKLTGEAYFEVRKTPQKSRFIVQSNSQAIEVLGTKFDINGYVPANTKTTLAEGSVRVTPRNSSIGPIILKPNQQAILYSRGMRQISVDAYRIIAWKDGYFTFDGSNTQEILQQIGDWYGIEVEYNNPAKSVRYTGKIPKNISLDRLVMLLGYQDINVMAYKDKTNRLKLIVN